MIYKLIIFIILNTLINKNFNFYNKIFYYLKKTNKLNIN